MILFLFALIFLDLKNLFYIFKFSFKKLSIFVFFFTLFFKSLFQFFFILFFNNFENLNFFLQFFSSSYLQLENNFFDIDVIAQVLYLLYPVFFLLLGFILFISVIGALSLIFNINKI